MQRIYDISNSKCAYESYESYKYTQMAHHVEDNVGQFPSRERVHFLPQEKENHYATSKSSYKAAAKRLCYLCLFLFLRQRGYSKDLIARRLLLMEEILHHLGWIKPCK